MGGCSDQPAWILFVPMNKILLSINLEYACASQAHTVGCLGTGWILVYMYEAFVCAYNCTLFLQIEVRHRVQKLIHFQGNKGAFKKQHGI